MEKTYTIEQIRIYLANVDSFGDAVYNLKRIDEILEQAQNEKNLDDFENQSTKY